MDRRLLIVKLILGRSSLATTPNISNDTPSLDVNEALDDLLKGGIDYSAVGGAPLDQYPKGVAGISIKFRELKPTILGANDFGFPGGIDNIRLSSSVYSGVGGFFSRIFTPNSLKTIILHEMLHSSTAVDAKVESVVSKLDLTKFSADQKIVAKVIVEEALQSAASGKVAVAGSAAALRPGVCLMREWNGRTYRVEVVEGGFQMDGKTYRSLSAIARKITGAQWSGPRFFGIG